LLQSNPQQAVGHPAYSPLVLIDKTHIFQAMQRIIIIGNPGSGKTTLAVETGKILDLPVFHLDEMFWKPGWNITEPEEWRQIVKELVGGDKWIIDGTYDGSLHIRLPRADTVIHLEFSTSTTLWRIIKRTISRYNSVRPHMPEGCPEKFDFEFFQYIWRFRRDIRPEVMRTIDKYFSGESLIVLKSLRDVKRFLKNISPR
jgi:adenylate kinase family enzyme